MEALAVALQDYKETIGNIAFSLSLIQLFMPVFICNTIRKQGNTENVSSITFLAGGTMGVLNLKFAFIIQNPVMIRVNCANVILNTCYLCWYYAYAENKRKVRLQIASVAVFISLIFGYITLIVEPTSAKDRLGMIVSVILFVLLTSPLLKLKTIIRTKSTTGMPFSVIFGGMMVTFMWSLYAIILRNPYVIFQYGFCFVMCAFQVVLMLIYPAKPVEDKNDREAKKIN